MRRFSKLAQPYPQLTRSGAFSIDRSTLGAIQSRVSSGFLARAGASSGCYRGGSFSAAVRERWELGSHPLMRSPDGALFSFF